MEGAVRVYINDRGVDVPAGTPAETAVTIADPVLAQALAAGAAFITDGRGIPRPPGEPLHQGAILRVIVSSKSGLREAEPGDAAP
jgi:hypothetical protein